MAFTCIRASSSSSFTATRLLVSVFILCWVSRTCSGFGSYGFDIHHRFSDPVKAILGSDELPEKGSAEYYAAMAHRDRLIRGRHLSTADETTPLTFVYGNETDRIGAFGHLHYANVSVGTPSTSYLVALDTGSNLLWLPCDCSSCVHGVKLSNGDVIEFEIYSPNTSSTSKKVSCNSTYCEQRQHCASAASDCQYKIEYLSNDTSSTGVLVEDVLHLTTDDAKQKDVNARIGFGCGKEQTGIFLNGAAPNGLLGLGMDDVSVPSILASQGLASNSFSMCFGLDGSGRISFGDNGSLDQAETPFNLKNRSAHPIYNITITQIAIGESVTDLEFYAIFDSGTSFTYLNDPAYTQITENFNSALKNKRRSKDSSIPFEYCYDIRPNQTVNLTLKGGKQYSLLDPLVVLANEDGTLMFYCLGIVKSGDVNIIGQNFMTGYRVIFDRERMVLGWKEFDCYNVEDTVTLPGTKSKSWAAPPGHTVNPEAKAGSSNTSHITPPNH
ncbi:PREDICTED: aspartyl protease family protein 1-like isoform X2 [Prunus mume]|uniref:Aspartyl protease family protein 1-like isoform X2 n=1 Tax=Prunus mume TaxID=102107 RepID=A0ABM0PN57_PRUMU|nr:PREDICTED: aspartyl protease family protein 1-like isoform X2 [Prunus mume]